jgi:pyruvate dehydrogenase E1 component beta subunit
LQPSTPHDAKGLLLAAIDDPNPVLIFEHKLLYKTKGRVPSAPYRVPIGQAVVRREGSDVTIVAASIMTLRRSLRPSASPRRAWKPRSSTCGRCARSTSAPLRTACGRRAPRHRVRRRQDDGHRRRDRGARGGGRSVPRAQGAIVRLGGADSPIPYNPVLEKATVPQEDDIFVAARELAGGGAR